MLQTGAIDRYDNTMCLREFMSPRLLQRKDSIVHFIGRPVI